MMMLEISSCILSKTEQKLNLNSDKAKQTRPSALGMSDQVIESQEFKETQEFPSILKML